MIGALCLTKKWIFDFGALCYALLLEVMIAAAILYWPDFEENIDTYGDILPFESVRKISMRSPRPASPLT